MCHRLVEKSFVRVELVEGVCWPVEQEVPTSIGVDEEAWKVFVRICIAWGRVVRRVVVSGVRVGVGGDMGRG